MKTGVFPERDLPHFYTDSVSSQSMAFLYRPVSWPTSTSFNFKWWHVFTTKQRITYIIHNSKNISSQVMIITNKAPKRSAVLVINYLVGLLTNSSLGLTASSSFTCLLASRWHIVIQTSIRWKSQFSLYSIQVPFKYSCINSLFSFIISLSKFTRCVWVVAF